LVPPWTLLHQLPRLLVAMRSSVLRPDFQVVVLKLSMLSPDFPEHLESNRL